MNKSLRFLIVFLLLCSPVAHVSATLQTVIMGGQYNDPKEELDPFKRSSVPPIYIKQDGHAFSFNTGLAGETIEVVGGDELLYTTMIGEDGKVGIPDNISGEVEIRLYRGSLVYHAVVEL